jgi:hypothetical protein
MKPTWLSILLSDAGKLHVGSDLIKYLGLGAGLAVAFLGHDMEGGVWVMGLALGSSIGVSQVARNVTNNPNIVAPGAADSIPKA